MWLCFLKEFLLLQLNRDIFVDEINNSSEICFTVTWVGGEQTDKTIIDRLASANNFWNWVMGSWWPTVLLNVLKCFLETKQNNNWFTCTTEEVFKAQLSKQWWQISYILKTLSIVFYSLFLTKSSPRFVCHVKLKLTSQNTYTHKLF